jgi:hypothetical protein
MGAKWNQRSRTSRLTAVLVLTCLVVALMASAAQAQPSRQTRVAALTPNSALSVQLYGSCTFSVRWDHVDAWMSVWVSGTTGVGYLNIYRRFASGNVLVSHKTGSIRSHSLSLDSSINLASGGRYFATWGINSASGNSSGGVDCRKVS